jgi:hypothetical protein
MKRRIALWLSVVVVVLVCVVPAAANTKQTTVVSLHFTQLAPLLTPACGFPVYETFDGSFKIEDYYDNSGTLLKQIITNFGGHFSLVATNPATGKNVFLQATGFNEIITFNPDGSVATDSLTGIPIHWIAPGVGTLMMSVGRLVMDGDGNVIFEAGQHVDFDAVGAADVCAYLADP